MDLFSNTKRSLFIARPWDTAMAELYKQVTAKANLLKDWDIQDGSNIFKEDEATGEREMFINRNKQLYEMFVSGIQKSDVFIADVTNVNANVMVELGIAIQLNKNVIIVTGQDKNKLPFDIHGFKADKYNSIDQLTDIINAKLSLYLEIKRQNFDKYFPENYIFPKEKEELTRRNSIIPIKLSKPIKNLRLRVEYKFVNVSDDLDWIGIHLRAYSKSSYPSELVYVRKNGDLEIVTLPYRQIPVPGKVKNKLNTNLDAGFTRLELILDENKLLAATSERELFDDSIQLESFGNIYIQATGHSQDQNKLNELLIEFRNLEIISLDTISPII